MKEFRPNAIRNIALIGHGGSGKTSISEQLLYTAGITTRIGKIEEGNTQSDYTPNEIERKISISATPLHLEWKDKKINILDTPGYSDFIGQVASCLRVADVAVSVIKGAEGAEVGTETTWQYVDKYQLPAAMLVNKLDNEHSNFLKAVETAKNLLSPDLLPLTFPVNEGAEFDTVVDVLKLKAYKFGTSGNKTVTELVIPSDLKETAEKMHENLVEKVAESSEELMNKFFENGALTDDELSEGIKKSLVSRSLIPVFAVSCLKGAGFETFLDFVAAYFPTPAEMPAAKGKLVQSHNEIEVPCDDSKEPAALVFKTLSEQHLGELSVFKVYSGSVAPGMDLFNSKNQKPERLGQLFILNGKNRTEVQRIFAGDIGAVVKLKDTHTSDTLASKNFMVSLDPIDFPEPIIRGAVVSKAKGDEDKISTGLHTIHEEDPTLNVKFDPELGQTIVFGQGELQLALSMKLLRDRYKVGVELGEPRIPYRETIKASCSDAEYKHKKQSGGRGQYGHVHLKIEPLPRGTGFKFEDAVVGGVVPGRFIPAVEKGVREVLGKGILTGSSIIDVKVTIFDGTFHPVDSDEVSFKIAGSQAFKKGFLEAKPVILEPIIDVIVKVPGEFMGDVMGDLSARRGKISGMEADGPFEIIRAKVPLAELYKYSTHLRSLTSGRGVHSRSFSHYEEVPKEVETKIIEAHKKQKEEAEK